MPVTTSATMIQSGPLPSRPSRSGMVVQSTSEIRSAIQVRPSRKRLDATPTAMAGIARRASWRAPICIGATLARMDRLGGLGGVLRHRHTIAAGSAPRQAVPDVGAAYHGRPPFMNGCLSFGGHDDRVRLDRDRRPTPRPGRVVHGVRRGRRACPCRGLGQPALLPRPEPVVGGPDRPRRRSAIGSAGSMPRPTSPSGSPASKASATASSTRGSPPRSWPGWAAAASRPTSSIGRSAARRGTSSCASSTRPTRRSWRPRSTTSTRSGRS